MTSGGHHWRHVQTCSLEDITPSPHWYCHLIVATEVYGTHPTGMLSSKRLFLVLEKDPCNIVAKKQKFCPLRNANKILIFFPVDKMFSRFWSLSSILFPLEIFHFDNCRKKLEMWLPHNENELDNFFFYPYFHFTAITCRLLSSAWMEHFNSTGSFHLILQFSLFWWRMY